ncbi:hypothetical protein OID55_42150 (plasmid) [Streptomyces sp. NBC_00715]|uniref:hypothetical protein n=1 Tax=Streptomyces sp. NBC_00715 TaxID=2975811 RepID=UPI002F9084AD
MTDSGSDSGAGSAGERARKAAAQEAGELLGARLRGLLQQTGVSQQKLATSVGVTKGTLTKYFNGNLPLPPALLQPILESVTGHGVKIAEQDAADLTALCWQAQRSIERLRDVVDVYKEMLGACQEQVRQGQEDLTRSGRELRRAQQELAHTAGRHARGQAEQAQTERQLHQAADRLDRLMDAYEQLKDQADAARRSTQRDSQAWQLRQAELLERLAQAEEGLAEALRTVRTAQQALAGERRAGRSERDAAEQARRQAKDSHAQAVGALQAAERTEARHRGEQDAARRKLQTVADRYAVAVETITRLQVELDGTRARLDDALARLAQAEGRLARFEDERAVENAAMEAVEAARRKQEAEVEDRLQPVVGRVGQEPKAFHPLDPFGAGPSDTASTAAGPAPLPAGDTHAGIPSEPSPGGVLPDADDVLNGRSQRQPEGTGPIAPPHRAADVATAGGSMAGGMVRRWRALSVALAGIAVVVAGSFMLKSCDLLGTQGPVAFSSGSKPVKQNGPTGAYGSGSVSYTWQVRDTRPVAAHFRLTHRGNSDLPGNFTVRPDKGCHPRLEWSMTAGDDDIEVASGSISDAGTFGINGQVDDADTLDLAITPHPDNRCSTAVSWNIVTW